jgi:hypothetical protein
MKQLDSVLCLGQCGKRLRGKFVSADAAPGTSVVQARGRCATCYRALKAREAEAFKNQHTDRRVFTADERTVLALLDAECGVEEATMFAEMLGLSEGAGL